MRSNKESPTVKCQMWRVNKIPTIWGILHITPEESLKKIFRSLCSLFPPYSEDFL